MAEQDEVSALRQEIESLQTDCRDLVKFIVSARAEITQIRPENLKHDKLPRAGQELDAIVMATESATNQIMSAAETIMSARVTDANVVNDACMEIFEACSFQDITGQRIGKVVSTLDYIEKYLDRLTKAWGHETRAGDAPAEADTREGEAALLNGPALEGEGVDQDYVDSMFDNEPAPSDEEKTPAPAARKKAKKSASDVENQSGETIDQDDIDALFN